MCSQPKKIEINKSSLYSLKAELVKKQEEIKQSQAHGLFVRPTTTKLKKITKFDRKNIGVKEREERDVNIQEEEDDDHKKSRLALEAKSKLYDKLSAGELKSADVSENQFLVNFDQKSLETSSSNQQIEETDDLDVLPEEVSSDPEEDWVDYTDCLGRTKRCLRRDLEYVKERDAKLYNSLQSPKETIEKPSTKDPELFSSDMKNELLRQKWEKQEELLQNKKDIHYQDVLFNGFGIIDGG